MKEETSTTLGNTMSPLTAQYVVLKDSETPDSCHLSIMRDTRTNPQRCRFMSFRCFTRMNIQMRKFYLVPLSTNQVLKVLMPHLIKQSLLNIIKHLMMHNHHYKQCDCCAKFLNRDVLRGYQVCQAWISLFQICQDHHHV